MITDYHASYYAHELTRLGGTGMDRPGRALFDASVDLNPPQIEAALFSLRSPISKRALLADEVGLGKTIEAGFVICQLLAERRRHILIICPASFRKQWALELQEKFNLSSIVLDARTYKDEQKSGLPSPFQNSQIVICSMHYASGKAQEIKAIPWDLVVIDEAHKLRNAYRESNRIGRNIRWATEDRKKLLLTATPLQNSHSTSRPMAPVSWPSNNSRGDSGGSRFSTCTSIHSIPKSICCFPLWTIRGTTSSRKPVKSCSTAPARFPGSWRSPNLFRSVSRPVAEQHALQEEIAVLERKKRTLRKRIFDIEDDIADKREQLIEALERRMQQKTKVKSLFTIQWKVV